jgi:hypothetical protein
MKGGYRLSQCAYHFLHVPNPWPWMDSQLRLPHHDRTLNRAPAFGAADFVRYESQRYAHCDQVRVEHPNLDAEFLLPPPVQKHGAGARPTTSQHCQLLGDLGGGLGKLEIQILFDTVIIPPPSAVRPCPTLNLGVLSSDPLCLRPTLPCGKLRWILVLV